MNLLNEKVEYLFITALNVNSEIGNFGLLNLYSRGVYMLDLYIRKTYNIYKWWFIFNNMNPIQLSGLMKRAYPNFDMTNFNYRLKLQKLVYLMKASGLNLGYDFRLHLNGPYSTMLSRDGFDMLPFNECQLVKFENLELEKKFEELLNFLNDKKDNAEVMEIIASLHLFHRLYPNENNEKLISLVEEKAQNLMGEKKKLRNCLKD